MSKENAKRVTFDQLVQRKSQKEEFQQQTTEIYSEELDAFLLVHRLTDSQVSEVAEYLVSYNNVSKLEEGMRRVIYHCCDIFQDTKLQKALGIVDPLDTINTLFTFSEIFRLGSQIAEFCDIWEMPKKDIEAVKN